MSERAASGELEAIDIYPMGYAVACAVCAGPLRHSPFELLGDACYEAIAHARDFHEWTWPCTTAWSSTRACDGCGTELPADATIPDPERGYWLALHERTTR
jgi:hypothetical protein